MICVFCTNAINQGQPLHGPHTDTTRCTCLCRVAVVISRAHDWPDHATIVSPTLGWRMVRYGRDGTAYLHAIPAPAPQPDDPPWHLQALQLAGGFAGGLALMCGLLWLILDWLPT